MYKNELQTWVTYAILLKKFIKFINVSPNSNTKNKNSFQSYIIIRDKTISKLFTLLTINFKYQTLLDLCGTDNIAQKRRFEITYVVANLKNVFLQNLQSVLGILQNNRMNGRLIFKTNIKENTSLKSLSNHFASANWLERECFDMFGIIFENHKDLRRILTDYGFSGFPLRKDFPLTGYTQIRILMSWNGLF
jgi:NADH-quinone oxidoreductase subunit C